MYMNCTRDKLHTFTRFVKISTVLATGAGPLRGNARIRAWVSGDMRMRVRMEHVWETPLRKSCLRPWDDTVPKTVDTRSHCKVWLRACNNLLQPPPYISVFWGCGRLLHALNHTLQWLLVSTVFGTVSSLYLISFLHLFHLFFPNCGHLHNIEGCLV